MHEGTPPKLRILSLDGGEARCMSQLEILREFMHRLNSDTGTDRLPRDYFHWIGGVGAGGVIAVLLVTFGMSADEASLAFARICSSVFPERQCSLSERAYKLEDMTKALLKERNLASDMKLLDEGNPSACKLGLFYMAAVNLGRSALFRNYKTRQVSYTPTVIEAIRVVWATPGVFPSIRVGPGLVQEELVSAANGFNNPTLEVLKEVHQVFGPDATVSCILSLGAGRATVHSVSSDGKGPSRTLEQLAMDCERTADEIQRRIGKLEVYFRFSVDRGLDFDSPSSPMGHITAHTGQYLLEDSVSSGLDNCIRACESSSRVSLEQLYHARMKNATSLRGLPPLSAYFVMRQEPMNVLVKNLVENKKSEQHIVVVAGMGGSGKTQLSLKFARDFEDSFQLIMFIDASSESTIKKGLVSSIRTLGRGYKPETVEDCLDILANSEGLPVGGWLIIYDNADDPDLDLRSFIPACDNGAILITTRNTTLQHMAPEGYLELDVMSPEEAIAALLQAALPSGVKPTPRDRQAVTAIAEQMGYLPIAIIQAGCYIRQHQCLYEYEDRLKANRKTTLERPAKNQRDTLKYGHSVYAALDITRKALSSSASHVLNLLSSVHFTNFPRPLISVAAKTKFRLEIQRLLDRPPSFESTIQLLEEIFCPGGSWDEEVLANALEELQQYSLVSVVPSISVVTLRLHPLIHGWAQDNLSSEDKEAYRAAAVRLIACGADRENVDLCKYLIPHIASFSSAWDTLHANDRIAFLQILDEDDDIGDEKLLLSRSQSLYAEVRGALGDNDIRTTRAALFLAGIYGCCGHDTVTMEKMEAEVVKTREALVGREHLETVEAMMHLSSTIVDQGRYNESEELVNEALKVRTQQLGECHRDTAYSMEAMAIIYILQGRYKAAQALLETVVATWTTLLGRAHPFTVSTIVDLADCLDTQGLVKDAEALRQEALTLQHTHFGNQHVVTLATMLWAGQSYCSQRRFEEARKLSEQALAGLKEVLGPRNPLTLEATEVLAQVYEADGRLSDSEALLRELLELRKAEDGVRKFNTLRTLSSLGEVVRDQGRLTEAEVLWKEEMEGRITALNGELDVDLLDRMTNAAPALNAQKRFEDLEILASKLFQGRKKLQGEDHPTTLSAIRWIARAKLERKNYTEAERLWRELLAKFRAIQGEKHIDTLHTIGWLARVVREQDREDEALILEEEETAGKLETLDPKNLQLYTTMERLVFRYEHLKRFEDGKKLAQQMIEKTEANLGQLDAWTIRSRADLAWVLHGEGKFSEAATINQRVLKERIALWGENHVMVARSRSRIASAYEALGRYDEAKVLAEEAIIIQRKELKDDNLMLKDTIELLEKLAARAATEHSSPKVIPVPIEPDSSPNTPIIISPVPRKPPVREETIDLDGHRSPTESQTTLSPPHLIARPVSPFEQRNKFGRSPNAWSMFM